MCTSGLANVGVQPLLDTILAYLPSPADRPFPALGKGGQATTVKADEKAGAAAFVWKTIADPFAGQITLLRVVSGILKSDSTVRNVTRGGDERLLEAKRMHNDEIRKQLAAANAALRDKLGAFRARQTEAARAMTLPPAA